MADQEKTIAKQLSKMLAQELLKRLSTGEATAAELAVARAFLKDQGVDMNEKNPAVDALAVEARRKVLGAEFSGSIRSEEEPLEWSGSPEADQA